MSYNNYDKLSTVDWNGQNYILTARTEISGNVVFTYAYSLDGINWNKKSFNSDITTHNPYSAKFLGDKFIIAGNLVSSYTDSTGNTVRNPCLINVVDGSYQVAIPTNMDISAVVYDIERNIEQPHKIVFPRTTILSLGNSISYSTNHGKNWTTTASSISIFTSGTKDAVWNGKLWVAVGNGVSDTIATSLDGNNWVGRGDSVFSNSGNGIDWSQQQRKFVATGSGTYKIATSMDGIYWKGTNTNIFDSGNDVKWNGNVWVAVGNKGSAQGTIAYSYDSNNWNYASQSFTSNCIRVYWNGTYWIAYGSNTSGSDNIATSLDGISWSFVYDASASQVSMDIPTGLFPDTSFNLYPGFSYPIFHNISENIERYVHNRSDNGTAMIQPLSIACGSGSTSLAYSLDGIQWTAVKSSLFTTRCNKAVWNGVLWVAVGAGSYWVATSYDGISWTGQNSSLMTECYDVAWNGSYFAAVGVNNSAAGLATSADGITWTSVSIASVFSTKVHAIEWTGNVWLAYGSGTNTTAVSSSLNAAVWTATSTPNLCVVDCSNLITNYYLDASSSSFQGTNVAAKAFDGSFNATPTKWSSAISNYNTSNGEYVGNAVTNGISGEWLQVQLTSPQVCTNYYVVLSVADASFNPRTWSFLGSNNATNWTTLDTFDYGSTAPNNSWGYPFVCLPLSIASNTTAYSYYRLVLTSNFGYGSSVVSVSELALFNSGNKQLDRYIRPIVLKDLVLHPTRILSVDGAYPNIYRISDLSCNFIREGIVHGGQFVNNTLRGLSAEPSATAFDGYNHIVCSASGEVSYLSNSASNTNLNFDVSLNNVVIVPGITGSINSACYNCKFVLLGGASGAITYGLLNATSPPTFYATNASSLFSSIYGVASNSSYGFVVSKNRIYLQKDERLSLVTPKFYDSALSSDTSISFNVWNSSA